MSYNDLSPKEQDALQYMLDAVLHDYAEAYVASEDTSPEQGKRFLEGCQCLNAITGQKQNNAIAWLSQRFSSLLEDH
jgi:hypothetical protein